MKTIFEGDHLTVTVQDSQYGSYETVHMKTDKSALVLVLSNNHVLLVEQFRVPVNEHTWELPGGAVDEGEDFITGGLRELAEETGIIADPSKTIEFLSGFNAPATINEESRVLLTVLPDSYHKDLVVFQAAELSAAQWFPFEEVVNLVAENRLRSFSVSAAILKLALFGLPAELKNISV